MYLDLIFTFSISIKKMLKNGGGLLNSNGSRIMQVSHSIDLHLYKKNVPRTSLVVQWLRIHLAMPGNAGSIPGGGDKIPHALEQLNLHTKAREIPHVTTKTWCNQRNKEIFFKKKERKSFLFQIPAKSTQGLKQLYSLGQQFC